MSKSSCDSISNSMMMTCFCGGMASCFTSRTPLNPGRRFYRCSEPKIENCGFWRWEDSSSGNSSIEVNLLKSKLEVASLKMENLGESLNAVKIERDNNLESLNYFELNKSRNLEAKVLKCNYLLQTYLEVFYT
ncbi:hypothetical protein KY290_013667 [Solanum tuberosum]|uniref:GRF-type domain-containing protein n=1 Tax=Solanum tuberosum TaxID=4113 RepID=A0ABQ7VMD7_SOLTU|nr:hypothetical protein KY289_013791 [Solanum tuberosum]KAH0769686.1 hypothetical protein KY290_013667 [Solanum tuberosum]